MASASGLPLRSAAGTMACAAGLRIPPSAARMSEPHSSACSGLAISASTIRASVSTAANASSGDDRPNTASRSRSPDMSAARGGNVFQVHAGHPATAADMMGWNRGRYRAANVTMGHYCAAEWAAAARTAGSGRGPARARLHRRLVLGGQRDRRVHPARAGRRVGPGAAAGHRHRGYLQPRPGAAGDERGHRGRARARPVRARHRGVLPGRGDGVERRPAGPALPAGPGHAAIPPPGAGRGEGQHDRRYVHRHRVPAGRPARPAARPGPGRAPAADGRAGR